MLSIDIRLCWISKFYEEYKVSICDSKIVSWNNFIAKSSFSRSENISEINFRIKIIFVSSRESSESMNLFNRSNILSNFWSVIDNSYYYSKFVRCSLEVISRLCLLFFISFTRFFLRKLTANFSRFIKYVFFVFII